MAMVRKLTYGVTLSGYDSADTATILEKLTTSNTTGSTCTYIAKRRYQLPAAGVALNLFPAELTGLLATGKLEVFCVPVYDAAQADKRVTLTNDADTIVVRTFGAFGCDTSLTATNTIGTHAIDLDIFYFVLA